MPGPIRGVARTAVVAERSAACQQRVSLALNDLKDKGIHAEDEHAALESKILAG